MKFGPRSSRIAATAPSGTLRAGRRVDPRPADRLEVLLDLGRIAHDQREGDLPLEHLPHLAADERGAHRLGGGSRRQAVAGQLRAVEVHAHGRDVRLGLDRHVDGAGHVPGHRLDGARQVAEHGEIGTEDLHRDVRPRAREHVVDPVRDRLADGDVHARNEREPLADLLQHLLLRSVLHRQVDVELGGLDALQVLVELGPSRCGGRSP